MNNEIKDIKYIYEKRKNISHMYNYILPSVYMAEQELERNLLKFFRINNGDVLQDKSILEIGGGNGNNILQLIKYGFNPENISFNELLDDRFHNAVSRLPAEVKKYPGNALNLNLSSETFDFIMQKTVFTSILDEQTKIKLTGLIWDWLKPGGVLIWYDFVYDNPSNTNVKGISLSKIKEYFPAAKISFKRVTLAPPLSRKVTAIHPLLYNLVNLFPFLRTHIICWIRKPLEINSEIRR